MKLLSSVRELAVVVVGERKIYEEDTSDGRMEESEKKVEA